MSEKRLADLYKRLYNYDDMTVAPEIVALSKRMGVELSPILIPYLKEVFLETNDFYAIDQFQKLSLKYKQRLPSADNLISLMNFCAEDFDKVQIYIEALSDNLPDSANALIPRILQFVYENYDIHAIRNEWIRWGANLIEKTKSRNQAFAAYLITLRYYGYRTWALDVILSSVKNSPTAPEIAWRMYDELIPRLDWVERVLRASLKADPKNHSLVIAAISGVSWYGLDMEIAEEILERSEAPITEEDIEEFESAGGDRDFIERLAAQRS